MNSRRKRPKSARSYRTPGQIEAANRRAFGEVAWAQRCCRKCGSTGEWQAHHVVEKRKLKFERLHSMIWDTRNAMRLCPDCHERHTNRSRPLEMRLLLDEHFEFAFYALGAAAHSYLSQLYIGEDPRLDAYLRKWEEENGDDTAKPGIAASV